MKLIAKEKAIKCGAIEKQAYATARLRLKIIDQTKNTEQ
jgi:hypothetical protein